MLCDDLDPGEGVGGRGEGKVGREVQEGEDIGLNIADSLHCRAETNKTL